MMAVISEALVRDSGWAYRRYTAVIAYNIISAANTSQNGKLRNRFKNHSSLLCLGFLVDVLIERYGGIAWLVERSRRMRK